MKPCTVLICIIGLTVVTACAPKTQIADTQAKQASGQLTAIMQITSFHPETACRQAVKVVNNNPYTQDLFEQVFAKVVVQTRESSKEANADIIWDHFVQPLKQSGKVPSDLAAYLWNCYFSKQFVSLSGDVALNQQCYRLAEIKKSLEKEYQLKRTGFKVSRQGDADTHFLNAMYVYNTMWAACHTESK